MLTVGESRVFFISIKIAAALNIVPIEIDGKTGKIQRQSSTRIFLWKIIFALGFTDCLYLLCRLVQSTLIEPEKYFRWDHFILHGPFAVGYSLAYCIGCCMFQKNPQECVMIFNQVFVEPENPVQKMVDAEFQSTRVHGKSGGTGESRVAKSGLQTTSMSVVTQDPEQHSDSNVENKGISEPRSKPKIRPLFAWPPQYGLDELLAIALPLVAVPSVCAVVVIFAFDPSRPQLLYSSVPPKYQNIFKLVGLLAAEGMFLMIAFYYATFSVVSQLLFFGKCQLEFKRLDLELGNLKEKFQSRPTQHRETRKEMWILRQILKETKELVIFIELFNRCFPPCIFVLKLICFLAILFYFFLIRHIEDFPILAVFTGYIAVSLTLTYGILYQKAFSIPEKMERLKNEFLLPVQMLVNAQNSDSNSLVSFRVEMKREIGGIRNVGVKVGSFHTLERESTPNFIDFVVKNVVNLLVTFQ